MNEGLILTITAFAAVSSFVMLIALLVIRRPNLVDARVGELASASANSAWSPGTGSSQSFGSRSGAVKRPDEKERRTLADRLVQAGLYKRNSVAFYVATQIVIGVTPVLLWILAASSGWITMRQALMFGVMTGIMGVLLPGAWLDIRKRHRQTQIRRALPDALDVIVVCVKAGLSLSASFTRVSNELRTAHPMLAKEMVIVQREIQMGNSTGEALRRFAARFDLEELRSLSSVVLQAEKFGASIVHALNVHAETLRVKRYQAAEEKAQKATVKLLFPTIFLIFPSIFVVVLGPAVFQLLDLFMRMQNR